MIRFFEVVGLTPGANPTNFFLLPKMTFFAIKPGYFSVIEFFSHVVK
jgi:hypothetical protein